MKVVIVKFPKCPEVITSEECVSCENTDMALRIIAAIQFGSSSIDKLIVNSNKEFLVVGALHPWHRIDAVRVHNPSEQFLKLCGESQNVQ